MAIVNDSVVDNEEILLLRRLLESHKNIRKEGPLLELQRLILRICSDGVVTSAERQELLAFLRNFLGEQTPNEKGTDFETYVITCFDNRQYRLIEWRSDKFIPGWGGPASSRWPDLVMEDIPSQRRFAIECKYRSRVYKDEVKWAKLDQIVSYSDYQKREGIPVYIALGLGGVPSAPKSLFIAKLRHFSKPIMPIRNIAPFLVSSDTAELDLDKD